MSADQPLQIYTTTQHAPPNSSRVESVLLSRWFWLLCALTLTRIGRIHKLDVIAGRCTFPHVSLSSAADISIIRCQRCRLFNYCSYAYPIYYLKNVNVQVCAWRRQMRCIAPKAGRNWLWTRSRLLLPELIMFPFIHRLASPLDASCLGILQRWPKIRSCGMRQTGIGRFALRLSSGLRL